MELLTNFTNYLITFMPQVLDGMMMTLKLFALTLVCSIPLGIVIAVARLSKVTVINKLAALYITVLRGTPLLLQIVFIFFGLPIIHVTFDRFPAAILAFTLNYAAYFAEIFRAGISAIDPGQYEGAEVLGLSPKDTFIRIIFPQAFKTVLPPVGNEVVTLIKDTALVYILGLDELLKVGKIACNRDATLLPLVIVALAYLVLTFILTKFMNTLENKYNYYR